MNYKPVYRHKCNSKNMNSELIRQMFFFSSDAFKYQYVIDILHKDGKLNINYRVDDFGEPHQNYIKSNDNTMISEPFVSMKDIPKKLSKYRSYIGFEDCQGYNATLGGDSKLTKDYEAIVKNYLLTKSKTQTAKEMGCCVETVNRALESNHITTISNCNY